MKNLVLEDAAVKILSQFLNGILRPGRLSEEEYYILRGIQKAVDKLKRQIEREEVLRQKKEEGSGEEK